MNWTILIWTFLYFAVSWLFVELCNTDDDSTRFTIFLAWPIIIGLLVISTATLMFLGLIKSLFDLFYKGD